MGHSVAVLLSGGLDSDVLVAELACRYRNVYPLYIRQGLAWEAVELYWLRRFLKTIPSRSLRPLTVLSLPLDDLYQSHWSLSGRRVPGARTQDPAVYLPGRNLILLVKAFVFCALHKIPSIALAPLGHNPFPDATPRFFKAFAKAAGLGLGTPVSIHIPYRTLSKMQVIQRGKALSLELSFSCLAPVGKRHCGRCNKCAERRRAFRKAGVMDRTLYAR